MSRPGSERASGSKRTGLDTQPDAEELAAVIEALRQVIDVDDYRHSPRLLPYKRALQSSTRRASRRRRAGADANPHGQAEHGKRGLKNR